MSREPRLAPALVVGLMWAVTAALVTVAAAVATRLPATAVDESGAAVHLKHHTGHIGALAAGGVVGIAAGVAGFAWLYTRPT